MDAIGPQINPFVKLIDKLVIVWNNININTKDVIMTLTEFERYCHHDITEAATVAQVRENTIRNWRSAGSIPIVQQRSIEVLTKGKLKADKS